MARSAAAPGSSPSLTRRRAVPQRTSADPRISVPSGRSALWSPVDHVVGRLAVEVDEHVPADDQVERRLAERRHASGDEVVLREVDDAPEPVADDERLAVAARSTAPASSARPCAASARGSAPARAASSAALEMSVARIRTGGAAGANASHARSASVYASSPVAQAAHQTRICRRAGCPRLLAAAPTRGSRRAAGGRGRRTSP